MTTPTPQPGATPKTGNSAGAQAFSASGISLPDLTTSGKSQFGLGNLAGAQVQVGGLFPVLGKGGAPVAPGTGGTYTAEQVMAAFATATPATIAQVQHMLMLGGFYGSNNYTPNYGVLNKDDIDAMSKATSVAAQTGGNLAEYLTRQAKFGEYQGVAAAINANGGKPRTIQKADPLQLASLIDKEYQALTGRKPNEAERAGFIAAYNAAFTHLQNSNYDSAAAAAGSPDLADSNYSTAPVKGFDPLKIGPDRADVLNASLDQSNLMAEPQVTPGMTPGVASQQDFDPQSFAEQYVHQHATGETDAHDVAGQFSNFLSILKGIG